MGNCLLTKGKENLQMDLLWTNPNLTSNFGEQSILISSLLEYSFVIITYTASTSALSVPSTAIIPVTSGGVYNLGRSTSQTYWRNVTVNNDNTLYFSGGSKVNSYGSDSVSDDSRCIPAKIYGIKSFKFIQKYVSGLPGIDTTNIIANTGWTSTTYSTTMTQDGWANFVGQSSSALKINGVDVSSGDTYDKCCSVPVKSGQTITAQPTSSTNCFFQLKLFGILGE